MIHNHKENASGPEYWLKTKAAPEKMWWNFSKRYNDFNSSCLECVILDIIVTIKWMVKRNRGELEG